MRPTRRQFLLGASGAVILAACGSDSGSGSSGGQSGGTAAGSGSGGELPAGFNIVQRFPNTALFTPGEVRLPVSLSDGSTLLETGPDTVDGWIQDNSGNRVVDVTAVRRAEGISVPYYSVRAQLEKPLIYTLRLEGDDGIGAFFEVWEPDEVKSPSLGATMPPFDTPTVDDHRGVEPYCSLTPDPCPLHDVTLTDALQAGTPVAYMVGTPAFCQTGTCAPGLELLVAEHERLGDQVAMVHADVYADDKAASIAPAVTALNVDYEPIVYFMDSAGIIVDRLDGVWDQSELRERLDALLA